MTQKTLAPERTTEQVKLPPNYAVVFYNDDFTPMDFVISLLVGIFHHSQESAEALTMEVHYKDKAIVGTYRRDIAETKKLQVEAICREFEHPLRCEIEPVGE
jgi:ATP-dependent Clp protease adaptor protein ClpS